MSEWLDGLKGVSSRYIAMAIIAGMGNQFTRLMPAQMDATITAVNDLQGCLADTNNKGTITITSR